MRGLLLLAIAVVADAAVAAASELPRLGVAVQTEAGVLCLSGIGGVSPRSHVLLIQASDPQSSFEGRVSASPSSDCASLDNYELPRPFLPLKSPSPRPLPGQFLIAVVGDVTSSSKNGVVELRWPCASAPLRFRACTSFEGVHLTAWNGPPHESRRIWHQYAHLGYET